MLLPSYEEQMKYGQVIANKGEWSRWYSPIHGVGNKNYRMACCDCGLVHEMQFRVMKDSRGRNSVILRAKRNNRATSAMRRKKK
jgi:hypothetical protein